VSSPSAAPAPGPSPKGTSVPSAYRIDIQGLRGLAVLLVVLFHVEGIVPGGYVGVDVFFVLSGFLITGLMLREIEGHGKFDVAGFLTRRVRRLLPALALMTVVTAAVGAAVFELGAQYTNILRTAVATSLFASNIEIYFQQGYFAPAAEENALLHTWSLSVEEQLYIALALTLLAAVAAGRRRGAGRIRALVAGSIALLSVLSLGLSILLTNASEVLVASTGRFDGNAEYLAFLAPVTRFWEFGVGGLLAIVSTGAPASAAARASVAPSLRRWAGLSMILLSAALYSSTTPFPGVASIPPVLGAALVLWRPGASRRSRFLESRALSWIGDRSYSWYLWHWPAIVIGRELGARSPTAVALWACSGLALAELSYRFVEQPFRRRPSRGPRIVPLTLGVTILPAAIGLGLLSAATTLERAAIPRPVRVALVQQDASDIACGAAADCSIRPLEPTVLLFGDSHAAALAPALRDELAAVSIALRLSDERPVVRDPRSSTDLESAAAALDLISELKPDVVVVHRYRTSETSGIDSGESGPIRFHEQDGSRAADPSRAEALYRERLQAAVALLADRGIPVIIVSSVPDFTTRVENTFGFPTLINALRGEVLDLVGESVPRAVAESRNAALLAIEREVAAATGATVVDPLPLLCTATQCGQVRDGELQYRDADHLTYAGASRVAPEVATAIRARIGAEVG